MRITVLGAGAWGTALAKMLQENGNGVTLWDLNARGAGRNPARTQRTLSAGRGVADGLENGGGFQKGHRRRGVRGAGGSVAGFPRSGGAS